MSAQDEHQVPKGWLQLAVQRVYVKRMSFEATQPAFDDNRKGGGIHPRLKIDVNSHHTKVAPSVYEAVLTIKVEATESDVDEPYCVIEFDQAGLFNTQDISGKKLEKILSTHCPSVLFPYARELIDNLMFRGGFAAIMLVTPDFQTLYQAAVEKKREGFVEGFSDSSDDDPVTH